MANKKGVLNRSNMKYKFKFIDILIIALLFIIIDDFKIGHYRPAIFNTILIICSIEGRIKQLKQ